MTAVANKPVKSLEVLKSEYDRMINRANEYRNNNQIKEANAFDNIAKRIKSEIDMLSTNTVAQKKNEPVKEIEHPKATAGATATTNPFELDSAVELDNNIVVLDSPDTEGVDIDDKYQFTSLDDFNEFKAYKDRLRDLLRNWLRKKDKQAFDYEEMNVRISLIVSKIINFIDFKARQEFKPVLKNQTYQIGDKKLMQEAGKEDVRFGFDVSQLKKDFNF